jgi:CBS domain containing-hemolysin-like protein
MCSQVQEGRLGLRTAAFLAALGAPAAAHASFLSGEALDTAANVLSWFVILVIPMVAIGLFFYVHILPEVIAEKNHHPHKHSIKVLCILSLFFGGMLWPFAWLWAYTKPIGYRAIYGTDKHDDYYLEMDAKLRAGTLSEQEQEQLHHELTAMAAKVALSPAMRRLLGDLEERVRTAPAKAPATAGGGNE